MATWLSGTSKQHRTIRQNAFIWCGIYLAIFALVILRMFWLQGVQGRTYRKIADRYHMRDTVLPATRGRLLDRNFTVLASDDQARSLFADPTLVKHPEFVAEQLAPVIGRTADDICDELLHQVPSVIVAKNLPQETATAVTALKLPGIQVVAEAPRYRVQLDPAQLPSDEKLVKRLAGALGIDATEIVPPAAPAEPTEPSAARAPQTPRQAAPPPPAPQASAKRWLKGTCSEKTMQQVKELKVTGVSLTQAPSRFSVEVDPRIYNADQPRMTAADAAGLLAPVLKMSSELVEGRLLFRPRFAMLKRDMTNEMYQAMLRLQGTMYVVGPGALLENPDGGEAESGDRMTEAVDRLYDMLNDGKGPELISKNEIRARLQPGATPGPLAIKLINGQPAKSIARRLFAKPIPGVMYGLPGINFQLERKRRYPFNTLASPTLGFINGEKRGVFGLEETLDNTLRGIDGREIKEIDARGMVIPERITERKLPQDGHDVVLTIDASLQQMVQSELSNAVKTTRSLRGQAIVMNPKNGEILALATEPCWDANDPGKSGMTLDNAAINHYYEPGSTFKLVAVMAALDEGVVRNGQQITHCSGSMHVGSKTIGEAHNAHGDVDCMRLMEQSCNLGAAVLALRLGPDRFLKWVRAFGFGQKTGIELRGELPGLISPEVRRANITLANMGFGQSIAVTIPQMAAAYAAAVNGGEWIQPHLVKEYVRDDGTREAVTVPRHRVCSEETAKLMQSYLENVCVNGTGKSAAKLAPGYRMGGKTGTAQKAGKGGYQPGKYIGSFVGIVPMDDPQFLILVVMDEPKNGYYGGVVAGPVVGAVAHKAVMYANIPPTLPVTPPSQPTTAPQRPAQQATPND